MRRVFLLVAALLVASVVAGVPTMASHAAAARDAVSPPQVVRTADGLLTLTIPRGAVTKKVRIRIRTLRPSVLDRELRRVAAPGPVYELLPDGLRFAKPITITRRVEGLDLRNGVPVLVPASRQGNGAWTVLQNPRVERRGNVVTTSGTTRHFSTIAAFEGAGTASLIPQVVKLAVGAEFKATVRLFGKSGDYSFGKQAWSSSGSVAVLSQRRKREREIEADLRCTTAGEGGYRAHFEVESAAGDFVKGLTFGRSDSAVEVSLLGTATCEEAVTGAFVGTFFYHPSGATSSLACATITGPPGTPYRIVLSGPGARPGMDSISGSFGATPRTVGFDIVAPGQHTFTLTWDGKSATATLDVLTTSPGNPSCRK